MAGEIPVLLLSRDPQKCDYWRRALSSAGIPAILPAENAQPNEVALVLTDYPLDQNTNLPSHRLQRGEIAVLMIGGNGPADVQLPADATPREIVLACRLLLQIVSLRRQLGREQRQQRILRELAATDPLTGLANRRAWDEMLQQFTSSQNASSDSVTILVLLDIDGFKRWNDEFGHVLADQQLANIAQRLTATVRRGDFVARWGGDEFALLLADVQLDQGAAVVERIRQAAGTIAERTLTLSAGWSVLLDAEALGVADASLRQAKLAGGNCTFPQMPDAS